ncbi:MAG: malonyl-CoA decarboxylase [Proteobacteria bacterium]|nr:malonyl-CoA decarboxylase [Pseudomonadota bacterium]
MSLSSRFRLTGFRQLSRAWTEIEQTALSRITGRARPGLPADDRGLISQQIDDCLSETGGAVMARARAAGLGRTYLELNAEGRENFLRLLAEDYGVGNHALKTAINQWLAYEKNSPALSSRDLLRAQSQLRDVLRSPRMRLLTQFNVLPQGLKFLCEMRAALLKIKKESDQLLAFDEELKDLLATWFDVGFLTLERITWDAPATLLEMLAEHEAVHSIRSWQDIKHRLAAPDRRCFAFTHEQMPHQPLIFVWVALTDGISDQIDDLLKIDQQELDPTKADTAIFYSISATQQGLDGVGFGSFLIKRVVDHLSRDHKQLKYFATLSPIPGFNRWLTDQRSLSAESQHPRVQNGLRALGELGALDRMFVDRSWLRNEIATTRARQALTVLAAHYLAREKRDNSARDRVANFHLNNGASIARINFPADLSRRGQKQSAGMMVNYRYTLKDIESNHESYHDQGKIEQSRAITSLLKTKIAN